MLWLNLVHCCSSPAVGFLVIHTIYGHYAHYVSVRAFFWTNSLGSPKGNVSVVSCVGHCEGLLQTDRIDVEGTNVFPSARTLLHHYSNSIICALTHPFSRAHNNIFSGILVF